MTGLQRATRWFAGLGTVWRILGITLLLVIVGEYLIGGAVVVRNWWRTGQSQIDMRYAAPVYDDDPDRIEYWVEFDRAWDVHFEPYYHWRRDPFVGKYINVSPDGIRRTAGSAPALTRKKIFMFGGSTMWGTGASDAQTIPSLLQSLLGDGYEVLNYGETGYVSTQELNYLLYQLSLGNIPDVVVFYDGVNDGYAGAYSPAIPRDPHNLRLEAEENIIMRAYRKSNYKLLIDYLRARLFRNRESRSGTRWDQKISPEVEQNSRGVVDMYEAHIRQVKALAQEYGFAAFFFWQPNLFSLTRNRMNVFERKQIAAASPTLVASQHRIYELAKQRFVNREHEGVFFLGNIFDEVDEPIYIDWHHVGPNGNEIVASAMLESMRGVL